MILEEHTLENTNIKFYDDDILENVTAQKEYIDSIVINLINKLQYCNLYEFHI